MKVKWKLFSCVQLFVTSRTIQPMEFSRPEWVAFPSPGDLPNLGLEPRSPTLQADSLPAEPPRKPISWMKRCRKKGNYIHCWLDCKMLILPWKGRGIWSRLAKLHTNLPFDLRIQLLGIYPRRKCPWLFIIVLFVTAKDWKPPRCPPIGK